MLLGKAYTYLYLKRAHSHLGLLSALVFMLLWLSSLGFCLATPLSPFSLILIIARTFLQTGLFITAHDAMHRSVVPQDQRLNDWIGSIASWLYAFLPYQVLKKKHHLHHSYPASALDPDYCIDGKASAGFWYLQFLSSYFTAKALMLLAAIIAMAFFFMPAMTLPMLLFWLLPLVFSSIQLFYFGTYLPHRLPIEGYTDKHRATSSRLPFFWSLISCYHFGYHLEHHTHPQVPWFVLPKLRDS
jgi:beta-carotene/zeaxanthin 4-ketolase